MPNQQTTFLAIGDVHGHWDQVVKAIESATHLLGHVPDLVLQVGDAEALRSAEEIAMVAGPQVYALLGSFWELKPGDLACPVYFIGGNHEPWAALDEAVKNSAAIPVPWGPNVYFLGRSGAAQLHGLNIAWLSGIYRPTMFETRGSGKKSNYHYVATDTERTKREAKKLGEIDILVTHDWPAGIENGRGTEHIRDLNVGMRPQLHVCGHMHTHRDAKIGTSAVHMLNAVPGAGHGENPYGWWRLYRKENGTIKCIQVGS